MYLVFDYDLSIWLDLKRGGEHQWICCIKMQRTLVEAIKFDREKYLDMISESASSRRRETQNTLLLCWISRIIWFASLNNCFQVNIVLKLRTCRPVVRGIQICKCKEAANALREPIWGALSSYLKNHDPYQCVMMTGNAVMVWLAWLVLFVLTKHHWHFLLVRFARVKVDGVPKWKKQTHRS